MAKLWYCLIDGKQIGPIGSRQVRDLASAGQLRPIHFVRLSTATRWASASQVHGLFSPVANTNDGVQRREQEEARWMVRRGDREYGPYTDRQLKRYVSEGYILPEHDIRLLNTSQWAKANKVRNLFAPPKSDKSTKEFASNADYVWFACGSCGQKLHCARSFSGTQFSCPACKKLLMVPEGAIQQSHGESENVAPVPLTPARRDSRSPADVVDEPVTVQNPSIKAATGEKIGAIGLRDIWRSLRFTSPSAGKAAARPARDAITFYGKGSTVDLGLGPIHDPFVYATGRRYPTVSEASLIELPLPIKTNGDVDRLPYWPTYHECSPQQRRRYLEWLSGGRSDSSIELGYVFIFFYGLENRILVDGRDHAIVIDELLRLLSIYTKSRSFINYASSLLWLTVFLSADQDALSNDILANVVRATTRWNESVFRYCLGYFCRRNLPLPFEVAFAIAEHDERAANSVVTRRHSEKFRELFAARFTHTYPNGFVVRAGTRERKIDYQPGSATLLSTRGFAGALASRTIPNVSSRRQFSPLAQIWNDCIDELRDYDRASKHAEKSGLTAEMYEAMPDELRSGDHPEVEAWQRAIDEFVDDGGWPVMPISKLAEIKNIASRPQLTKKQSLGLIATADAIGIAIEPDARRTNRNYRWDELVVVFREQHNQSNEDELNAYKSAAILLELGMCIAQADGQLDESEIARVADYIENESNLSARMSKRLDAFKHLLAAKRTGDVGISRSLQTTLSRKQRSLIGQFLVGVAAADNVICADERKLLSKAYRNLGLPVEELNSLVEPYDKSYEQISTDDNTAPHILNLERIRQIREETVRAQSLLHDVFSNADGVEPLEADTAGLADEGLADGGTLLASTLVASVPSNCSEPVASLLVSSACSRLDERYRKFCNTVVSRPRWNRDEITDLARKDGLMLNAALEVLNEWSTDEFGDWLIEESGSEILVRQQLMESA